jgi:hypothetical protein
MGTLGKSVPTAQEVFQNVGGGAELGKFAAGEGIEMGCEVLDAALAALLEKARALRGGADVYPARVAGIASDIDQVTAFESGDDAGHGRRFDLLGGGELAERFGAGKDQNGESGQLCRAHTGSHVLQAHTAQQVDGGRMKAVGGGEGRGPGRDITRLDGLGLDFRHRI